MITPEVFALNFAATTPRIWNDEDKPRWEDVNLAQQGLKPEYKGFIEYVYQGNPAGRHSFFAGLFMEVMGRPGVQLWIQHRRLHGRYCKAIESMVLMAIGEWGSVERHTDKSRSKLFGVCRTTWLEKYKPVYTEILEIPATWEQEIIVWMNKRLR